MVATLDGLEKKIEALGNQLADRNRDMRLEHRRLNGDIPAVSFLEADDDPARTFAKAMAGMPRNRCRVPTLPKSYVPSTEFQTFGDFMRLGMLDQPKFANIHNNAIGSLAKSLNVNVNSFEDGGAALVLPEFAPEIMTMLYKSQALWSRTRQYTVAGNSMTFPKLRDHDRTAGNRHGGVTGYWPGQSDAITESQMRMDTLRLDLAKLAVAVFVTEEMLQDSGYALEQFVTEVVQAEIDYQLDRALLRGDGVNKPIGIFNSAATITQTKESGQAAATIVSDNVLKMWSRRFEAGPEDDLVWINNQDTETQLGKLYLATGANSGQLTYQPPGAFADRPHATLMGRPVIASEHASTLGTVGDLILANLKFILSVSKGQVNQISSPHVQFLRDLLCIKFTFRINARPWHNAPIRTENSTLTRSPFVVLETRA